MRNLYRFLLLTILVILCIECAKKGRPTGGKKDEKAPIMVTAKPPYGSVNVYKKQIRIYFDEYIVLRNLNSQLLISPPFKNTPIITPQGTASKYIKIKISDTLKPNTTYTLNFGNAIQDNNENNKLEQFKYVFSTGKHIDSLKIRGKVADILEEKPKKNVSVLLYKLDSVYNDSVPYRKKPDYLSNTQDSINFQFTNLKKGKYLMVALNEKVSDYLFNPKTDKIGFLLDTIYLPKDSVIEKTITLFEEKKVFKFKRGKEVSKGKIQFQFMGGKKGLSVKLLSKVPQDYKGFKQFEKGKDTLNYWFTPIKRDSLNFIVRRNDFIDTITVRLRKKKIDSLKVNATCNGLLHLKDTMFLTTNNPIVEIDTTKFFLIDKDSTKIPFKIKRKEINKLALLFEKKPKTNYNFTAMPNAFTDLYKTPNDSLNYNLFTKSPNDYGNISLMVKNEVKKPIILQLLSQKKVIKTIFLSESKKIDFNLLPPKEYTFRAIIDNNNNKIWDTGNFLQKIQPERILYYPKKIKLRANWTVDNTADEDAFYVK